MQWVKIFSGLQEARERIAINKPVLVSIYGVRLALVNRGDQFYAVQNACTHSGASLSDGKINYLGEIVCPLHGYIFDLSTGREVQGRSGDLKTYPVKIEDDGFFVGI